MGRSPRPAAGWYRHVRPQWPIENLEGRSRFLERGSGRPEVSGNFQREQQLGVQPAMSGTRSRARVHVERPVSVRGSSPLQIALNKNLPVPTDHSAEIVCTRKPGEAVRAAKKMESGAARVAFRQKQILAYCRSFRSGRLATCSLAAGLSPHQRRQEGSTFSQPRFRRGSA